MTIRSYLLAGSAFTTLTAALVLTGAPTLAQNAEVNEIIVTVRQRAESVVDVPGTVNVLQETTLTRAGVQRAEDFIGLTPGISLVDSAEVGDTQVNIRGINGARDAENSFAFIVDGVLMTNPAAFNREYVDLQQIEIFKGPQGAIYGRNAAAGAIIVTTQRPGNEYEAQVKASYGGGDESYFVSGTVAGPIVEDQLFFRFSADWRDLDGFYSNTFLGRDDVVDDFEGYNFSGRLVWTPTPDLTIDTKARYGKVDGSSITFNAAFALEEFANTIIAPALFEDVNDHTFVFQANIDPTNNQESIEVSTKIDYDMPWASLTGWFLYSDIKNDFLSDGTSGAFGFFATEPNCVASAAALVGTLLPLPQFNTGNPRPASIDPTGSFYGPYTPTACDGYQFQERNQEDFSFEVRLTSPQDQRLRWQGGFYFLDISREVGVATGIDTTFLGVPIIESLTAPTIEAIVHDQFDSTVIAVFGQAQYDVTQDVELSLALRYDREKRKVDNLIDPTLRTSYIDFNVFSDDNGNGIPWDDGGEFLNPGLNPLFNPDLAPDGSIKDQKKTFEQIQPKVSVTWDVQDDLTLFASWGIGFKSGGFNNQGSAATIGAFINTTVTATQVNISDIFQKEKSSAFEGGFKGQLLDGQVSYEGAVYYTSVDDMQFFEFFVGPFGLLRVVSNIDKVRLVGGEFNVRGNLNDSLNVYAGFGVTESKIRRNAARPDTVGNESPYTPKYTINAGAEFTKPIPDYGLTFVTRLDFQYVGPTWFHTVQDNTRLIGGPFGTFNTALAGDPILNFGTANYSKTRRDGYPMLNLRVGMEAEHWAFAAFVKNLTNEKYLEEVIPAPEFGGSFIHPGSRRSAGVEAILRF